MMDISSWCSIGGRWLSLRRFTPNIITSVDDLITMPPNSTLTVKISVPVDRSFGDWNHCVCIMINITWCIKSLLMWTWKVHMRRDLFIPLIGGRWWTSLPPIVVHPHPILVDVSRRLFAILNRPDFNFHPIIVEIYPSTDSGTPLESKLLACRSQRIRRA